MSAFKEIFVPNSKEWLGTRLIFPLRLFKEPGWDCDERATFQINHIIFEGQDKTIYGMKYLELEKININKFRPTFFNYETKKNEVCVCKECMRVHKDKKPHYKTEVVYMKTGGTNGKDSK